MSEEPPPEDVLTEVERLTRLARAAVDEDEAAARRERRDDLLADHGYRCREREDDRGETLVCYPAEWLDDSGTVRFDAVSDTDRAVELSLSGPGDPEDWQAVDERNREVASRVRSDHGDVHGANAAAFADFMSNHYAKAIEEATERERREFREEYYPRNAWPSEEQRRVVEQSLRLTIETARESPL